MVDIFLMGTAGDSKWRDPIIVACAEAGIECFDPRVPVWDEAAMQRETEALRTARVIVMAITPETAGIASLAESGWAALSAWKRKQAFGLYIDPAVEDLDEPAAQHVTTPSPAKGKRATRAAAPPPGPALQPNTNDVLEEASVRARKLALSHASALALEFPDLRLYVARSLADLQDWAIRVARQLNKKKKS